MYRKILCSAQTDRFFIVDNLSAIKNRSVCANFSPTKMGVT